MSSQPLKSNNPFRSPPPIDGNHGSEPEVAMPEPEPNLNAARYDPDLTLGFEDLSLQPGSVAQLYNFYAGTTESKSASDNPPPAYTSPPQTSRLPNSEKGEDPSRFTTTGPAYHANIPHTSVIPNAESSPHSSRSTEEPRGVFSFLTASGAPISQSSSFSRPPPVQYPYTPFPATYLISNGKHLDKGFPPLPPPSELQPHPFVSHDVNEADWISFLDGLKKTACLPGAKNTTGNVLPAAVPLPVLRGLFRVGNALIKGSQKSNTANPVTEYVDLWNHNFFRPRRMEIILTRGQTRLSGISEAPIPSLNQRREKRVHDYRSQRRQRRSHSNDSSSSSSSSSSDDGRYHHGTYTRRESCRENRRQRREDQRQRRAERRLRREERRGTRGHGAGGDKTYRLFVVAL